VPVPDFVLRLRARIGHDLLWLPGVSGVVIDDDGRLLLARRADNGLWAVVSGVLEPGEEPAVATAREVLEETGVVVEVVALTAVSVTDVIEYSGGDVAQYLDTCFWCRPIGGEAHVADDESLEVGWFHREELPAAMTTTSRGRIARTLAYVAAAEAGTVAQPWFAV
jgi:8-oxo-dGTP pyrophosphatase MutT (NUDIX family)